MECLIQFLNCQFLILQNYWCGSRSGFGLALDSKKRGSGYSNMRRSCSVLSESGSETRVHTVLLFISYRTNSLITPIVPIVTSFKDLFSIYRAAMEKDFFRKQNLRADVNAVNIFQSLGNDLSTPQLPHFPGLRQGNNWCLCVSRYGFINDRVFIKF